MEKRFSIVIPAFNVEKYIERAIESILIQNYKNYEIIVIDDCSSDNTAIKIKQYSEVKYIKTPENLMAGGARNLGIKNASGEYIVFLDSDDYLYDSFVLEKLNNIIAKKKVDIVYMGFQFVGNRDETIIPSFDNCDKTYRIAQDPYPNVWSKCWRRCFLIDNNIWFKEKRLYEDFLFLYEALFKSNNYAIAEFPVHKYTSGRKGSITTTISFKNVYDTVKNIEDMVAMKKNNATEELDLLIKKEIKMCKKRLESIV